jgi:Tfp pilus assembly protein PilN
MLNINFVPDDYIQSNESRRTNLIYLVLLALVMAALAGSFLTIRIRLRNFDAKERMVNAKMTRIQESIKQFEQLQVERKDMMKTALTTTQLLEPVPRSILLASLTNNLPPGVSLLRLKLIQKEGKDVDHSAPAKSKYQEAKAEYNPVQTAVSQEQLLETHIDIEGMAPSDLQVASYIERLSNSSLFNRVSLVESTEHKVEDTVFRKFKLKADLRKETHLTRGDVDRIRAKAEQSVYHF